MSPSLFILMINLNISARGQCNPALCKSYFSNCFRCVTISFIDGNRSVKSWRICQKYQQFLNIYRTQRERSAILEQLMTLSDLKYLLRCPIHSGIPSNEWLYEIFSTRKFVRRSEHGGNWKNDLYDRSRIFSLLQHAKHRGNRMSL